MFRKLAVPVMDAADQAVFRVIPDIIRWELAILNVTTDCNSRCIMCNYVNRYDAEKDLDAETWKKIIRGLESFGLKTFIFTGGEPLARKDFLEIARCCRGSRSINTNGILVDEPLAGSLAELFDAVNVSIDGSGPEVYERVRGADHFHRVLRNVRLLKAAGARLKINCQLNRYNYHDAVNMARLAESLDVDVVFSLVVYGGFNQVYTGDRSLRQEIDFGRLKDLMAEALTYERVSTWISLRDCLNGKLQQRCYAHIGGPIIDPAGRAFLCCGDLPPIGNVREDDLETLWAAYRGMRSRLFGMELPPCRDCLFYMGNFEYLQRGVKHLMARPLRKRLKRHSLYRRYFLSGR
jgi:MoaA/NifB/PqqE/SkfB family radical SAM enzyme